ncbi:SHOCT domain-containing protein [Alkalihalobacillus oceani]|uniref:SHOCT domain-containing protein n=1 Tax=Halalkalibacter oceani TaxID=1653776 RepID=UPI00203F9622|nr:SHOCT domain-containing protein [Halalkalibacter oceani]MCM3763054.1 SHOCT domain-containing protein [Halalkalibacter oceani]
MMNHMFHSQMWTYMLSMGIVALALLSVTFLILKLLFNQEGRAKSPYAILEERYASGEISEDEFEKRKKALK